MPIPSRFTADEREFLKSNAVSYNDHRLGLQGKTLRMFWNTIIDEFFEKFPRTLPDDWQPGDSVEEAGDNDPDNPDEEVERDEPDEPIEGSSGNTIDVPSSAPDASSKGRSRPLTPQQLRDAAIAGLVAEKTKVSP